MTPTYLIMLNIHLAFHKIRSYLQELNHRKPFPPEKSIHYKEELYSIRF